MKYKIICILVILICAFSLTAGATSTAFEIQLSKDYNTLYQGDDPSPMAKRLGMEKKELQDYMKDNGVLLIAVSKDRSKQVRIIEEKTEFSSLAEDISALDEEALNNLSQRLTSNQNSEFQYVTNNKRKYIKFSDVLSDSGGSYVMTQYITIKNGRFYKLCFYNSGELQDDEADAVFNQFKLSEKKEAKLPPWLTVVFVLAVALFTALSVAMVIGIIREKHQKATKNAELVDEIPSDDCEI